MDRSIYHW